MFEAVFHDRLYLTGTVREVRQRLREHAEKYLTLAELCQKSVS